MATCIGGLATSHSPQLNTEPPIWLVRAEWDRSNPVFDFQTLLERPGLRDLSRDLEPDEMWRRYERCQSAIARLSAHLLELKPDVVVIVGDDQHEMFPGDVIPAISIYGADSLEDLPRPLESLHASQVAGEWAYHGTVPVSRPTNGALGKHLVKSLTKSNFDVTHIRSQPEGRSIGHAYTFIQRRLMGDRIVPIVPIMVNTDHTDSSPSPARCWTLGKALRDAIDSFDEDLRVMVVGSGGLSHFKVDEALDAGVLECLASPHEAAFDWLPDEEMILGTSEIRNWIVTSGALQDRRFELIDYVPAYRSEAGTGCGMGFAIWR